MGECYLEIDSMTLGTSRQDGCWGGEHSLAPGLMAVMTKKNGKNLSNTRGSNSIPLRFTQNQTVYLKAALSKMGFSTSTRLKTEPLDTSGFSRHQDADTPCSGWRFRPFKPEPVRRPALCLCAFVVSFPFLHARAAKHAMDRTRRARISSPAGRPAAPCPRRSRLFPPSRLPTPGVSAH